MAKAKIALRQKNINALSTALLRNIFVYNKRTGLLRYRAKLPRGIPPERAMRPAGYPFDGYVMVAFLGHKIFAHRLAWKIVTGHWPREQIDHKNLCGSDNRWENIREATHGQNLQNCRIKSHNGTGYKGVQKNHKRWMAMIVADKRRVYLGTYDTPSEAHRAYCEAADRLHGKFARHA